MKRGRRIECCSNAARSLLSWVPPSGSYANKECEWHSAEDRLGVWALWGVGGGERAGFRVVNMLSTSKGKAGAMPRACLGMVQDCIHDECLALVLAPSCVLATPTSVHFDCWSQLEEARSTISRLEREMGGLYRDKSNLLEVGEGREQGI